jgi:hypothetical protein
LLSVRIQLQVHLVAIIASIYIFRPPATNSVFLPLRIASSHLTPCERERRGARSAARRERKIMWRRTLPPPVSFLHQRPPPRPSITTAPDHPLIPSRSSPRLPPRPAHSFHLREMRWHQLRLRPGSLVANQAGRRGSESSRPPRREQVRTHGSGVQ